MSRSIGANSADAAVLTVSRIETVADTASVRHFDQLDERTQTALLDARRGRPVPFGETDLTPGEVVVFTDYLRVARQ